LTSGTVSVNGGGTLSGVGTINGTVTIGGTSAGTLTPGNSPGVLTITNLTLGNLGTAQMEVQGNAGAGLSTALGGYDQIVVTGKMAIANGSTLAITNANSAIVQIRSRSGVRLFWHGDQPVWQNGRL
jgi:fibronectin-binding autotransporter adhesin